VSICQSVGEIWGIKVFHGAGSSDRKWSPIAFVIDLIDRGHWPLLCHWVSLLQTQWCRSYRPNNFTPILLDLYFSRPSRVVLCMGTPGGWRPNGARYRKSVHRDPIRNRGRWFRICGRRLPVTYRSPDFEVRVIYPRVSLRGRRILIFWLIHLRHLSEFCDQTQSVDSPQGRLSIRGLSILP
jgi:hypothetical protein